MKNGENLILVDFKYDKDWDFKLNLEKKTGLDFECILVDSNMWQGKITKIIRYCSYFLLPLYIIFFYRKVKNVVAWQQFYGLLYAFWCRLLHLNKPEKLIVTTFIYKEKSGFLGKLYKKFITYIVESNNVDYFICYSKSECEYYSSIFENSSDRFIECRLTELDVSNKYSQYIDDGEFYVSAGRSNRDYDFLCDAFSNMYTRKLFIISDTYHNDKISKNIQILNSIHGDSYFELLAKSKAVIIPLKANNTISSGQLVMIHSLMLGKICVVTDTKQSREYIEHNFDGILIDNNRFQLDSVLSQIEQCKYEYITKNAREAYVAKYKSENLSAIISTFI